MTNFFLIRHGETDWNAESRLQGHIDIELNDHGLQQAYSIGQALRTFDLDHIYTSDLKRAYCTALPAAHFLGLPIHAYAPLRERCYGAFEGLRKEEIALYFPKGYAIWLARVPDGILPNGTRAAETLRQFTKRIHQALNDLALRYPNGRIALFSHGGVLDCVYRLATGFPSEAKRDFSIANASINHFKMQDGILKLKRWGDVSHLATEGLDELDDIQVPIE